MEEEAEEVMAEAEEEVEGAREGVVEEVVEAEEVGEGKLTFQSRRRFSFGKNFSILFFLRCQFARYLWSGWSTSVPFLPLFAILHRQKNICGILKMSTRIF